VAVPTLSLDDTVSDAPLITSTVPLLSGTRKLGLEIGAPGTG